MKLIKLLVSFVGQVELPFSSKIYYFDLWVIIYINRGIGMRKENVKETAQNVKDKAENAASRAAETMSSAASGN